jgi:hypothetical protein
VKTAAAIARFDDSFAAPSKEAAASSIQALVRARDRDRVGVRVRQP